MRNFFKWTNREGTNLNKFTKSGETTTEVILQNAPDAISQAGTPFSTERMNSIEEGILSNNRVRDNFSLVKRGNSVDRDSSSDTDIENLIRLNDTLFLSDKTNASYETYFELYRYDGYNFSSLGVALNLGNVTESRAIALSEDRIAILYYSGTISQAVFVYELNDYTFSLVDSLLIDGAYSFTLVQMGNNRFSLTSQGEVQMYEVISDVITAVGNLTDLGLTNPFFYPSTKDRMFAIRATTGDDYLYIISFDGSDWEISQSFLVEIDSSRAATLGPSMLMVKATAGFTLLNIIGESVESTTFISDFDADELYSISETEFIGYTSSGEGQVFVLQGGGEPCLDNRQPYRGYNPAGVLLAEGRKAFDEKTTSFGSYVTSWVTLGRVDSGNTAEGSSGEVTVITNSGDTLACEYAIRPSSRGISFATATLDVKLPADGDANYDSIVNFRFWKSDVSQTVGWLLQVKVVSVSVLTAQLIGNISRSSSFKGFYLLDTFIAEDTPVLPDGSAGNALEAGTEFSTVEFENSTMLNTFSCSRISDNVLGMHFTFKDLIKPDASLLTFDTTGATVLSVHKYDDTDSVDLLTESYNISNLEVKDNEAYAQLSITSGFSGWGLTRANTRLKGTLSFNFT